VSERRKEWVILYADGSTFSDLDGSFMQAPRNGVMQVFYASELTGVSVESSQEGYWLWRDGVWMGSDVFGYHDYMFHDPGPLCVLFGRTRKDEVWMGEVHRMSVEIMGEPKSAWTTRERRY
jgi:hypothetical protein